ncbi:hypothetical protein V2J09_007129 [Rumex salicifolius]
MWLSKLMGYSYEIQYKQSKENCVADALSRAHEGFYDSVKLLWHTDPHLQKLITELQANATSHPAFTFVNNELWFKGKLVIDNDQVVKLHILQCLHDSALGGHSSRDATLHRVKSLFYWPKMSTKT